jgi:UDP-N-acetylglucosamine 2-epimerase
MLRLIRDARMVLTDSGGLQKEAFWSGTPCITLRDRTEWTETVDMGVNFLASTIPNKIRQTIRTVEAGYDDIRERFRGNPFGDGNAAKRITEILKEKGS